MALGEYVGTWAGDPRYIIKKGTINGVKYDISIVKPREYCTSGNVLKQKDKILQLARQYFGKTENGYPYGKISLESIKGQLIAEYVLIVHDKVFPKANGDVLYSFITGIGLPSDAIFVLCLTPPQNFWGGMYIEHSKKYESLLKDEFTNFIQQHLKDHISEIAGSRYYFDQMIKAGDYTFYILRPKKCRIIGSSKSHGGMILTYEATCPSPKLNLPSDFEITETKYNRKSGTWTIICHKKQSKPEPKPEPEPEPKPEPEPTITEPSKEKPKHSPVLLLAIAIFIGYLIFKGGR